MSYIEILWSSDIGDEVVLLEDHKAKVAELEATKKEVKDRNHAMAKCAADILHIMNSEDVVDYEALVQNLCTKIITSEVETDIEEIRESNSLLRKIHKKNKELESENESLREDSQFLEEEVWDMLMQTCLEDDKVDSMCMSAYIPSINYFIKKGKLKEISRGGRRIIAEILPPAKEGE